MCFLPYVSSRIPQVLPCGHTFCSTCMSQLAATGNNVISCPECRAPASAAEVKVNFALRDALPGCGVDTPMNAPAAASFAVEPATEEETTIEVNIEAEPAQEWTEDIMCLDVMITLVPPVGKRPTPSDICCVVDVSDSMGCEAMIQDSPGVNVSHGLSVLDIVKHALRTVVHILGPNDRLAVVAFANSAHTIFNLTPMGEAGKRVAEQHIANNLNTDGMTNLWGGLQMGINLLEAASAEPGRLRHLMLLTDGVPTVNPPRGILPMLKRVRDAKEKAGSVLPCTINTFGFGYELDSELLSEISIIGGGTYAFIPDSSFVGTVFVNAMTNLIVTMATNVCLTLAPLGDPCTFPANCALGSPIAKVVDGALQIDLPSLQFGQNKDVIIKVLDSGKVTGSDLFETRVRCYTRASSQAVDQVKFNRVAPPRRASRLEHVKVDIEPQRCRLVVVDGIRKAMKMMKQTAMDKMRGSPLPLPEVQAYVHELSQQLSAARCVGSEAMQALHQDLTGQVAEACSREDWYDKWGIHYLPSLMCAHLAQQCNNFKDPGVQHYGGDLFGELRDKADDIFCGLPPPTPSVRAVRPTIALAAAPKAAARAPYTDTLAARADDSPMLAQVQRPVQLASMDPYYDRYAG